MYNSKAKSKAKIGGGKRPSRRYRTLAVLVAVVMLGWASPPARGDEAPKLHNAWDVTLGGGGRYMPAYEGGSDMTWEAWPSVDISWYDADGHERTFLNVDDGLGIYLVSTTPFRFGPLITWQRGRKESDSSELRGLGNVNDRIQAGAIVGYQPHDCCDLFAKLRRDMSHDHGLFADIGGEITVPLAPQHWFFELRLTTTWANAQGQKPLFGITPAQSATSGLAAYAPSAGFRDVTVDPTLIYSFNDHWSIAGRVTYERLLDQAADSPLVRTRGSADQVSYEMQLLYHF